MNSIILIERRLLQLSSMNTKLLVAALAVGVAGVFVVTMYWGSNEVSLEEERELTNVVTDAVVPEGLPENIPFYPGATTNNVQETTGETGRNSTFTLETSDSVDDVNAWYREALSQNGWTVTSDRAVGGYILLRGEYENVAIHTQVAHRADLEVSIITQRIQIKTE